MTNSIINESYLSELQDMEAMKAELDTEIKARKAIIKAHMVAQNITQATFGNKSIEIKTTAQTVLDTKKIKDLFPEIYEEFGKTRTQTRIIIGG